MNPYSLYSTCHKPHDRSHGDQYPFIFLKSWTQQALKLFADHLLHSATQALLKQQTVGAVDFGV